MARLPVQVDEDQEFVESTRFSLATAEELLDLMGDRLLRGADAVGSDFSNRLWDEAKRSFVDVIETCVRRAVQMVRRADARGQQRFGDGLLPLWIFSLELAVHGLEHETEMLSLREARALRAGRKLLELFPATELREVLDVPLCCPFCKAPGVGDLETELAFTN